MNPDFTLELTGRLCLTLLHSLWQVAVLTFLVWCLERCVRSLTVERRYTLHAGALVLAIALLPVTFLLTDAPGVPQAIEVSVASAPEQAAPVFEVLESDAAVTAPVPTTITTAVVAPSAPPLPSPVIDAAVEPTPVEDAPSGWVTFAPWIAGAYAVGVLAMLARLLLSIGRAQRLKSRAVPVTAGPLVDKLRELSERLSFRVRPMLAQAERVVVPQLVGLIRPTILLPTAAINGLSVDDLEMILLHELAHVRRHDLWINLLQRLAEVVLFFNPALWYLSRRISSLREYCCDELTCNTAADPDTTLRTRYATALVRVAELSQASHRPATANELATLASTGRTPSELRRRIAHLLGEPLNEPVGLSRGSLLTMIGVMSLSLVSVLAGPPGGDSSHGTDDETQPRSFELIVQGPDGNPVPHAMVEVRSSPAPMAEQVLVGEYVRSGNYGPFVRTDEEGRLVLQMPDEQPQRFNLSIKTERYGPYWAGWSTAEHPETIPSRFVAELEAGWTVGGVVVDSEGKPVEGVKVRPSIKFKKRPGDTQELGIGTQIETDAEGRWQFDSVPASMPEVFVEIGHPDFKPNRQSLTRAAFEVAENTQPAARIELDRGLIVVGRVTDEDGEPVVGALLRTKFLNDVREAVTDQNGEYQLSGCEARMAKIVVSADGKAVDMQQVRIGPDLEPVNFQMQPGGHVRIRVLDFEGNPVPKARIFFQKWRDDGFRGYDYFEFDHVDQYADENGIWEWNEAPLDEFKADIAHSNHMQLGSQPLFARDDEYVFRLPPTLVINGRVIDKLTRKPIKTFRVVPGVRSSETHMNWVRGSGFEAADGEFTLRHQHDYYAHLLRIEADGYGMQESRDIKSNEGEVQLEFELTPADDIGATILTPDAKPAGGSKVALGIAGSQITVTNGDIEDGSTLGPRRDADAEGRFRFPAQNSEFQLVITHPSGYAYLKSVDAPIPASITLTPWARVEGVFHVGPAPAANVTLDLDTNTMHSYGKDVPNIFTHHNVTTGPDGRFVFERVVPGEGRIRRNIMLLVDEGATEVTSAKSIAEFFPAGETTTLDLGGDGRSVIGKLVPPPGHDGQVLWNFALINTRVDLPQPQWPNPPIDVQNDPERRKAWWAEWSETPAGLANAALQELRSSSPYFTTTVDRDGIFRIDDVSPGNYVLDVRFSQHAPGAIDSHHFTVTSETEEPLDLGMLQLQ